MKLLNRKNFAVNQMVSKEESRYSLRAVLVTENETVATDGHILGRVSLPDFKPEQFPVVEGFKANGFKRGLLPIDSAKEIEKAIPKKQTIPILNTCAISSEMDGDTQKIQVCCTDLDTPKVFAVRPVAGQFPNWEMVFPDTNQKVLDICFNAHLLRTMADAVIKFSDHATTPVRLRFYQSGKTVERLRFDATNDDGQEMNGLIMALRATVEPKYKPETEVKQTTESDTVEEPVTA